MRIRPFKGLVPVPQHAAQVAAVPYDVVNREEAAALAEGNPLSLLHVDRAEIDLPKEVDPYSAEVYQQAAQKPSSSCKQTACLVRESGPSMYLYKQTDWPPFADGSGDDLPRARITRRTSSRSTRRRARTRRTTARSWWTR